MFNRIVNLTKSSTGVTLIELMVMMTIVGILGALIFSGGNIDGLNIRR